MADGDEDDAQKTEEPTQRRIEESRKKGQVALSREVNNWVMLTMATILILALAPMMFRRLTILMKAYIEQAHDLPVSPGGVAIALSEAFKGSIGALALPLILLMLAAFAAPFVQVGPLFAPESIQPKLSKISPIEGFKRLFSMRSLMEFAKGLLKIAMVGAVGVIILKPYFGQFEHFVGLPMMALLGELKTLVGRMMIGVLVVLIVIAMADLVYQRYEHAKKMRMSKQEIKEEFKQTEGDPHVKARLRQLRTQRARQRMMQAVPEADVVITNPTHYSIALKYDPETMEAPVCVAKGVDELALRIREVAREHKVEVYEHKPLARALYPIIEIDDMIPPEQYKAVAEVISYVFRKRGRT
jgi:flagellar biosynthetic protein FlhB